MAEKCKTCGTEKIYAPHPSCGGEYLCPNSCKGSGLAAEPVEGGKEIDHTYTAEIVCPTCGSCRPNSHEFIGDRNADEGNGYCDECNSEFTWQRNVAVTYSTAKAASESQLTKKEKI
jgi:hypothetical protein